MVGDLARDANDALEGDVVLALEKVEGPHAVEAVDRFALLEDGFHLLRTAREDVRVEVERLADTDLVRNAQLTEGDLAWHGARVGNRVELHSEAACAVRFGENVSVRLDAVREHHGATQHARGIEAVGELDGTREITRGAEALSPFVLLRIARGERFVAFELRRGWSLVVHRHHAWTTREADDTDEIVFAFGFDSLVDFGASVFEGRFWDRLGDVHQIHGADLLGGRRSRQARQSEGQQRDERHAKEDRDHALGDGKIGEALAHHPHEIRREQRHAEHLRRQKLVVDTTARPGQRRTRRVHVPLVRPEQDAEDEEDETAIGGLLQLGATFAHTVSLLW